MPATKKAIENKKLNLYIPQLERVDERLDMFMEEDQRQFIIVRAHRYGVPIYEYCGGVSANDSGIKQNTISCVFSITKPVAGCLIMKLQEDGLLDISDPMCRYFDIFEGDGKEGICIWHLLTHTSGLVEDEFHKYQNEYLQKEYGLSWPENATDDEYRAFEKLLNQKMGLDESADHYERMKILFKGFKPEKGPGQIMSYNNFGYMMIGKLIEKVSGISIDEYSRKVLFAPLGMKDTHFILPKKKWARAAARNEKCNGHDFLHSERLFTNDIASGSLKSTVADMCRFGDMLLGNGKLDGVRVLSPASICEMKKDHNYKLSEENPWSSWGLGFNIRTTKKDDAGVLRSAFSLEHGGAFGHKFLADPEYGVTICVFTGEYEAKVFNGEHAKARNIFYSINNMIIAALD